MASNFSKNKREPQANPLTFRVLCNSAECKINQSAWKTDLLHDYRFKSNQHTPKRPDSGRSDTGQSYHTVQSAASVQSWTLC
jgi:hypothetical protein